MNNPVIPAEAVEAAAIAMSECGADGWEDQGAHFQGVMRRDARRALEAAAPHLMAEAFEQGQKSGMRHADRLVAAAKIGKPALPGPISPNPYRSASAE